MKRNQRCMRWLLSAGLTLGLAVVLAPATQANTPDGETPAEESVCDDETSGKAWGLCNAYCEAMDCDADPAANPKACERVEALYTSNTGNESLPCEEVVVECPCVETWENQAGAGPISTAVHPNPQLVVAPTVLTGCQGTAGSNLTEWSVSHPEHNTHFCSDRSSGAGTDDELFAVPHTDAEFQACVAYLQAECVSP